MSPRRWLCRLAALPRRATCGASIGLALLAVGCAAGRVRGTQLPERPGSRSGHNLVFDRAAGRTLLLFGYSGAALPPRSEIWSWKDGAWSVVDRAGPGFRSLAGVAVDEARARLLLFGGAGPGYRTRYGDTWSWTREGWTELVSAGPGPVDHHAVAYDRRRGALIVFGGNDPSGAWARTTWALDSAGWRVAADSTVSPPARAHYDMVYDATRERVVLFGGLGADRRYLNDTWEWDGVRWSRLDLPAPPARTRHRLAYESRRRVVVLYGGAGDRAPGRTSGFDVLSDLWEFDGRAWRSVGDVPGPGRRMVHAMTFDAALGETLLYGGSDGSANRDDLWSWDGARWMRR